MNIGFIGQGLNLLSGSGKPTFQLMKNLNSRQHKTLMLSDKLEHSLSDIQSSLIKKNNMENLEINRVDKNLLLALLKKDPAVLSKIMEILDFSDLVICSDFIFPWLVKKNNLKIKAPLVFFASNNLFFKLRFLFSSGILSTINLFKSSYLGKILLPKKVIAENLEKFDHILTPSKFVKDVFLKQGIKPPISFIRIGADITSNYIPITSDHKKFLYFGWGSGIRGIQDVLASFEYFQTSNSDSSLKVLLQGRHGYEEKLYFSKINQKKNHFNIEVDFFSNEINEQLLASMAVILPFRIPYGYSQPPLTILESMALGRPVISTNIGSIPEIIKNGSNGFLVNPGKPKEILSILKKMDIEYANNVGYNAYKTVKEDYNWYVLIDEYINFFREVISETRNK